MSPQFSTSGSLLYVLEYVFPAVLERLSSCADAIRHTASARSLSLSGTSTVDGDSRRISDVGPGSKVLPVSRWSMHSLQILRISPRLRFSDISGLLHGYLYHSMLKPDGLNRKLGLDARTGSSSLPQS